MPLIMKMINGESVDFGMKRDERKDALQLSHQALGGIYEVGYYTDLTLLPNESIAVLSIKGAVTKYGDYCSWGMIDYSMILARLAKSPNVSGVVIDMDSPGGQAYGTSMLADQIKETSKLKPVIGVVNDGIAASAGLWLLTSCDEVYVTKKTDMVGSCGVYCSIYDWYGYYESLGLKVRDVYAPQSKDKNKSYNEAVNGNDEALKKELATLAQQFIDTVQSNRGERLTSNDWNTGKMFYAEEAMKIGLIDGIKSMDEVFQRMETLVSSKTQKSNNNITIMEYPKVQSAAKAEGFQALVPGVATEVQSAGVFVSSEQMTNIEESLTIAETTAAAFSQAQTELSTANTTLASVQQELNTAKETIATQQAQITKLEGEDGSEGDDAGKKDEDDFQEKEDNASDMAFQKELLSKVN